MINYSDTNKNGSVKMTISPKYSETKRSAPMVLSKGLEQSKRHKVEDHQARIGHEDWMDQLEREERWAKN